MTAKRLFTLGVLAAALTITLAAQTAVDDLISKNLAGKGGLEKLKSIQSMKQTSTMTMQGSTTSVTVYSKRPNLLRQELKVPAQTGPNGEKLPAQTIVFGFDGEVAWIINPLSGVNRPVVVTGPQADVIREQANFDGPLVDYQARGAKITLIGMETLGDRKVQHLQVIDRTQQMSHLYLDAETNLEVKIVSVLDGRRFEQELSDYRDVEGVKFPFSIKMLQDGIVQSEIKVQSVEFNGKLDDSLFKGAK